MPNQEQGALEEDVVDDGPSKEHEVLEDVSQIPTNVKVHDGSTLLSCDNWAMHIRPSIRFS